MKLNHLDTQTAAKALQAVHTLMTLNDSLFFMNIIEIGLILDMERDLEQVINKSTK